MLRGGGDRRVGPAARIRLIQLQVRLEAADTPVGYLVSDSERTLSFAYADAYRALPGAHPISFSLPFRDEPFADAESRAFFQNLLPENDQLDAVIAREGLDRDDLGGILAHVGADLPGALSCLPLDAPPVKIPGHLEEDYDLLGEEDVVDIVARLGRNQPLPGELRDPSPVAGFQRKIALVERPDGRFAIPKAGSGVPTTHILKVPDAALPREAFYEAIAAGLANVAGLDAAPSRSRWFGQYEAVLATRFDRSVDAGGAVRRIHQEDFAQALGLPPRLKYQRDGRPGREFSAEAVHRLLQQTVRPAEAVDAFLRATFFNLAVGNTDNHAKNHALLYDDGPAPRLAPLYDIVPIRLSENHHHRFSFAIGDALQAEDLRRDDMDRLLGQFGLNAAAANRFLAARIAPIVDLLGTERTVEDAWGAKFYALIRHECARLRPLLTVGNV